MLNQQYLYNLFYLISSVLQLFCHLFGIPYNILNNQQQLKVIGGNQMVIIHTIIIMVLIYFRIPILKYFGYNQIKPQKNIVNFLSRLNRWDQLCKFVQYCCVFATGYLQNQALYVTSHIGLLMFGRAHKFQRISRFFSTSRKLIRAARLQGHILDLYYCFLRMRQKQNLLEIIDIFFGFLSDLFNVFYYFTDHYILMFLYGILSDRKNQYIADYLGSVFWIVSNIFQVFKDIICLYRLIGKKNRQDLLQKRFLYLNIFRNIIDTILAYDFIDTVLEKKNYGILAIGSSLIQISTFWK